MSDENKVLMTNVFYNNAVLTEESSDNEQTISRKLYSSLNGQGIFNVDEKNNVARTFKKYNNINKIYACDGSVSFSGVILKHITRYPDYYIFGIRARLAYNQKGFYKALNYTGAKKRKPTGFYWIY